ELRLRGHQVRLVTSKRYASLAAEAGLDHSPLSIDFEELMPSPAWQVWSDGKGPAAITRVGWR
ncbi:hypothetical protein ACFXON_24800, partial [Bacillus subtilis]